MRRFTVFAAAIAATSGIAFGADFPEVEPNDSKATATVVAGLVAGDTITGNSISGSTTGLDYYDVTVGAAAPGIYRHRLVLSSSIAGHTGSIRGLSQTAAPADTLAGTPWDGVVGTPGALDNTLQSSSATSVPARFNQWYGFGKQERLYYRVAGVAATTANYVATMESTPVVPTDIGTFQPGSISISTFAQGHTTDTDFWVYDSGYNAMPGFGNDDESVLGGTPGTGTSLQGFLSRTYAPGTYYLALSNFALANNQTSPSDDDFRTGTVLDFANIVANSSTTLNLNLAFTMTDSVGSVSVPNTKLGAYDVNFFKFTVAVPEPTTLAFAAIALPALLRRRR